MQSQFNKPLISVVIATYNGEKFLRKQLNSLIAQTYQPIEIIAVDDCSTDQTFDILKEYAHQFSDFTVIQNEHNLGYIKNFEKGFQFAKGEYIAPCDQDDIWLPQKIEKLFANIKDYAIVYCNSLYIDKDDQFTGDRLANRTNFTDFNNPLMYVVGASAPSHAMLIKKEIALKAMPFPALFSHDNWLGFVATFDNQVKFIDEVLVYYRRHDTNVFSTQHKRKKDKESKALRIEKAQKRLQLMKEKCPNHLPEKKVFEALSKSYENYSLANNWLRMLLFFKYRHYILRFKKHGELRRKLYCLKTFFKII